MEVIIMTSMEQAFNELKNMDLTELFAIPNPDAPPKRKKNTPATSEAYGKI
jgi:hypothetical protein